MTIKKSSMKNTYPIRAVKINILNTSNLLMYDYTIKEHGGDKEDKEQK